MRPQKNFNLIVVPIIASISGIRGTIGGKPGESLSPIDVVKYSAAFGTWLVRTYPQNRRMVLGRDARISGEMVRRLVVGTLQSIGIDVIDIGLATTPTVEIAVTAEQAAGGIILSASHNPKQWNALKLLNHLGEFISEADGQAILHIAGYEDYDFADINNLGQYYTNDTYLQKHIDRILALPPVNVEAIKKRQFKILIDGVNSVGGWAVPRLLKALGVEQIVELYCTPDGQFPHNPEPLPENLGAVAIEVKRNNCDLAFVVDPDVDRLAIICEDGSMFGEEYTLVAVADYILQRQKGPTVSNLSSSRALRDVAEKAGVAYHASAVGEVNVVAKMKEVGAVIGGEGNGGIIYPALHYGRDALVGIALFLSYMAEFGRSCTHLRSRYPNYHLIKNKAELTPDIDMAKVFEKLKQKYKTQNIDTRDGLRIEFDRDWIHLRMSNTEPIMRIYAESLSSVTAWAMIKQIQNDIKHITMQ